jgi:hypothetical protein
MSNEDVLNLRCWRPLLRWTFVFVLGALTLGFTPSSVSAEEAEQPHLSAEEGEQPRYSGRFELTDSGAAEAERDRSVKEVAQVFPALFRKMAIGKMRKAANIVSFVEFSWGDASVVIRSDESAGWKTGLDKKEEEFRAKNGKMFLLSRWMEDGALHSKARGETGTRSSIFRLSDAGDVLTVVTRIQIDQAEESIVYTARYKRAEP